MALHTTVSMCGSGSGRDHAHNCVNVWWWWSSWPSTQLCHCLVVMVVVALHTTVSLSGSGGGRGPPHNCVNVW